MNSKLKKSLVDYGDSDEENTNIVETPTPIIQKFQKDQPKVSSEVAPKKNMNKMEIFQALGLKSHAELSDSESEDDDLSSTVPQVAEIEKVKISQPERLIYKPKKIPGVENAEHIVDAPAMREGSDFMKKFQGALQNGPSAHSGKVISSESRIMPVVTSNMSSIETEFELDPTQYDEDEEVEFYEDDDVSSDEESINETKPIPHTDIPSISNPSSRNVTQNPSLMIHIDKTPNEKDQEARRIQQLRTKFVIQDKISDLSKITTTGKSQLSQLAQKSLKSSRERENQDGESLNRRKKTKSDYGW